MLEKMQRISNPLTVIGILAALAEVGATVALPTVPTEIQYVFVWFVMLFPALLVVLFFLTLNFNQKALYAPRDYRSDEPFVRLAEGASPHLAATVTSQLEEAITEIKETRLLISGDVRGLDTQSEDERQQMAETILDRLDGLAQSIDEAREASNLIEEALGEAKALGEKPTALSVVLKYLSESPIPPGEEIRDSRLAYESGLSKRAVRAILRSIYLSSNRKIGAHTVTCDEENGVYRVSG